MTRRWYTVPPPRDLFKYMSFLQESNIIASHPSKTAFAYKSGRRPEQPASTRLSSTRERRAEVVGNGAFLGAVITDDGGVGVGIDEAPVAQAAVDWIHGQRGTNRAAFGHHVDHVRLGVRCAVRRSSPGKTIGRLARVPTWTFFGQETDARRRRMFIQSINHPT